MMRSLSAALLALWGCAAPAHTPRRPPATRAPLRDAVVCPGILRDDLPRSPEARDPGLPPELVVLGEVTRTGRRPYELEVERVLYGHVGAGARLRFVSPSARIESGTRVVALAPSGRLDAPYRARYSLDAAESDAALALAQARLDCLAAGSSAAVVSNRAPRLVGSSYRLEVDRVLYGSVDGCALTVALRANAELAYRELAYRERARRGEPMVYLLREPTELDEPGTSATQDGYVVVARFPGAMAAQVRDAGARRSHHPVVTRRVDGAPVAARLVLFAGPTDRAVAFLSSASEGAVELMRATLSRRGPAALPALLRVIDRELLAQSPPSPRQFAQLRAAIQTLGALPRADRGSTLETRIQRVLAHAREGNDAPPMSAETPYRWDEASLTDVNHALTWLCVALGRAELARGVGPELIDAQVGTAGAWRRELALAIETSGVQDELDLAAALDRGSAATPAAPPAPEPIGEGLDQYCSFGAPAAPASGRITRQLAIAGPRRSTGGHHAPPEAVDREQREVWYLEGAIGGGRLSVGRLALDSGTFTEVGAVYVADFTGNRRGLVPDGRQLYLADPGYYAFDRSTLTPTVRAPWFGSVEILGFAPDGKNMVLVTADPSARTSDYVIVAGGVVQLVDGAVLNVPPECRRQLLRVAHVASARTWWARWLPCCAQSSTQVPSTSTQ
jgi:hypothetical protein